MAVVEGLAVLVVIAAFAAVGWRRWRAAQREVQRVRATFGRYVAPAVVDMLLARKDERLFTGRAVQATVLVCRIRDFARFIEPLAPEETLRYLNEFYGLAGTAIQRNRGLIDSFLGDGIIGVFGVPLDNPTHEEDAVEAALAIVRHVVAMRDRWARQHRKPISIGIGINTGTMIAGDAGFRDRREFTVVGSEATFAHQLQEAAFELNAFIVASRRTCDSLISEYKLVPVSGIPLAGVRRLLDASVVRGRLRGGEQFTVPVDAMVQTSVEAEAAPAPEPAPAIPEPPIARPRPRPPAPQPSAASWFSLDDVNPILPEPPPPRATYEDKRGSLEL